VQDSKLRRNEEERCGRGKESWTDKSEDHNSRAEIWNLFKLVWRSYVSMWDIQKSSGFLNQFRNPVKGVSENTDDTYYIHFKMRSLNSDFTKAKNYLLIFCWCGNKTEKKLTGYLSKVVLQGNDCDLRWNMLFILLLINLFIIYFRNIEKP